MRRMRRRQRTRLGLRVPGCDSGITATAIDTVPQRSTMQPRKQATQLIHPPKSNENDGDGDRDSRRPIEPLPLIHVADITSVHPEDTGDRRQRKEHHSHDSEGVQGQITTVFGDVHSCHVLRGLPVSLLCAPNPP